MNPILKQLLKSRNFAFLFSVACLFVLSILKTSWVSDYSSKSFTFAKENNEKVYNWFQSSFYFSYEEEFKPKIKGLLAEKNGPLLSRIQILTFSGQVVFDSKDLETAKTNPYKLDDSFFTYIQNNTINQSEDGIGVLIKSGQFYVYYSFSLREISIKVWLGVFLSVLMGALIYWLLLQRERAVLKKGEQSKPGILLDLKKYVNESSFGLHTFRTKFLLTIIALNIITGAIFYFSQSYIQKKEQVDRIVKMSVILGELSKETIISSFSNFFYFYYQDKFVPSIKSILSSKENLAQIRIISRKSGVVVFDSEDMLTGLMPSPSGEGKKANLPEEAVNELKTKDTFWKVIPTSKGDSYIQVITAYRNENQETPFLIEYAFTFASLNQRIEAVQKQILFEIIPSVLLGILVALIFAQLVVGPIKKLVVATNSIAAGNYDIRIDTDKKDEFGDLIRSFNSMADELNRKNELKKYLSDHSYKKIVEAPGTTTSKAGSRVKATVLFCDIRNFVNVCESLDAEEVTSLLNEYFSAMVEVIYKHKGEIDKFIGDAILAVFYEHENLKSNVNTALHAIYCSMEMQERLREFNAKRVKNNRSPIQIGIGINSGEIISGPIGSPDRMDFTVIGDVVNLANRIEKLSKAGRHTRIVFSNHVEERIRGLLDYEELSRDKIRGKDEEIIVYELIKIKDVDELLSNLTHPDPNIKKHCIELLGYSQNKQALPSLYQKLSDSNESVRVAAVVAISRLSRVDESEPLDVLFKQLDHETSEKVISTVLMSIGKLCRTNKLLKLTRFLSHKDERIVANAIESIGQSDDPQVIDLLIPFVASKSNRVKANAAMVLFAKGRVEVIDTLKPMLLHSDYLMRASAAFALGELTVLATSEELAARIKKEPKQAKHFLGELQGSVPLLVSLLKDPELLVKRQAIVALGKIKDKSAVLPLLDNLSMENESSEVIADVAEALRSIGSHRLVREVVKNLG